MQNTIHFDFLNAEYGVKENKIYANRPNNRNINEDTVR